MTTIQPTPDSVASVISQRGLQLLLGPVTVEFPCTTREALALALAVRARANDLCMELEARALNDADREVAREMNAVRDRGPFGTVPMPRRSSETYIPGGAA